jgi:hypothetical protein
MKTIISRFFMDMVFYTSKIMISLKELLLIIILVGMELTI